MLFLESEGRSNQSMQPVAAVKCWEIIADKLSKAGWTWAVFQPRILKGEQSGLLMRTAAVHQRNHRRRQRRVGPR